MRTAEQADEARFSLIPIDLVAVLGVAGLALALVVVPTIRSTPISAVVGGILVFVAPGYALVAALFPAGTGRWSASEKRRLDTTERIVLGSGLSVAVVGLGLLALDTFGVPLTPFVVVGAISTFTVVTTVVAIARRRRLPPTARYRVAPSGWFDRARIRRAITNARPSDSSNLVVLLVVASVVVAVTGVGFAMTQRGGGESFTELSLLTERDDGELVAGNYPTQFERGEEESLILSIGNHEHETLRYTVIVQLDGEETHQLDRLSVGPVAMGETVTVDQQISPQVTGDSLRLSFLLYRGDPPENANAENAYREVHLWIDVADPEA